MLAYTFPGQGSQRPGMGQPWVDHPSWKLVDLATELAGRDVARLLLDADADELQQTRNAQLTTYVLSLVVLDAVRRLDVDPAVGAMAGHSLGEYTALTAAGVLTVADGVRLVATRGEAMQAAAEAEPGTMAAILGLADDLAEEACRRVGAGVWVANFNAPGQVVVAGTVGGVTAAGAAAKELGAKRVMALPVGGAFHTPLMAPAAERLGEALASTAFADPSPAVLANVDAAPHPVADDWAALLATQLTSPVRWRHTVSRLADDGITTFVELGPGGVLTGMAKRITSGCTTIAVATPDEVAALAETLVERSEAPERAGAPARHPAAHLPVGSLGTAG